MLLFDMRGSFGLFSSRCAKLGGRAVAVDPSAIATRMTVGSIEMLSSGVFADGFYRVAPKRNHREMTCVDVITIDNLSARLGVPWHLKIDAEGYEGTVLRGARKVLSRSSLMVFLELHDEMVAASGGGTSCPLRRTVEQRIHLLFSVWGANQ
jgi:hypothetical protein